MTLAMCPGGVVAAETGVAANVNRCRAICWTATWSKGLAGVGVEHLLLQDRAADSVVLEEDDDSPEGLALAEAERAWLAGEFQAAARLSEAADVISQNPTTIQLRYLQTLTEIGVEQNSTVVFPLPMDVVKPFLGAIEHGRAELERGNGEPSLFTRTEREHAT